MTINLAIRRRTNVFDTRVTRICAFLFVTAVSATAAPPESLEELRDMSLAELEEVDVVRMNLIVAKEIEPDIDIPAFERLVDVIALYVQQQIELNEPLFEIERDTFNGCREKWLVALMWDVFTNDFNFRYLAGRREALDHSQPWQKFIHGPLTGREGTCCTLPVLYLAVGQRLGFPIRGVEAPLHLYCRWEGSNGVSFNFETTSDRGMVFPTDEEIFAWESNKCPDSWKKYLFKPMNARNLLGHFLLLRSDYYCAVKHYRHAVVDVHNALWLYPRNPAMVQNLKAYLVLQEADPEYRDNAELRALRPRMPAWELPKN